MFDEEFKKRMTILAIVALVLSIVFGGAFTKGYADAVTAGDSVPLFAAFGSLMTNITSF